MLLVIQVVVHGVVVVLVLTRKLLECLALRLGDQECREDSDQHEESEDLHDVVQPWRGSSAAGASLGTSRAQRSDQDLGNDGTELSGSSRDTVRGRPVTRGEYFTRDDERGSVGSEVLEEVAEDVESELSVHSNFVVSKSEYAEENGLSRSADSHMSKG